MVVKRIGVIVMAVLGLLLPVKAFAEPRLAEEHLAILTNAAVPLEEIKSVKGLPEGMDKQNIAERGANWDSACLRTGLPTMELVWAYKKGDYYVIKLSVGHGIIAPSSDIYVYARNKTNPSLIDHIEKYEFLAAEDNQLTKDYAGFVDYVKQAKE